VDEQVDNRFDRVLDGQIVVEPQVIYPLVRKLV
jgi:hypothetical protein